MSMLNNQLKKLQTKQGVKFKTGFMNLVAKKVMTPQVFIIVRQENNIWKLDGKTYLIHQFNKILQFMTDNNAEVLLIQDNLHATIVKELALPHFHELRQLNLSNNSLTNIEAIIQLKMPKLSKLDISQNQITLIRSLNRLLCPITSLKIYGNPIIDAQILLRSSFIHLAQLDLQAKSKQPIISQSLGWLIRMPSRSLNQLKCASRKRIKENHLYPRLAQIYPKGRILLH